ncbi:MAG TPA: D-glycero-beta-D-manno-heptose-7-phosphate kinase [Syntrophobacteria bacterium]|nr:D-glycero-beta-D-manno-heptose-7-phosphate kinase [Syntrophobacteria bacterium]
MLVSSPFYGIFVVDLQKVDAEVKPRNMLPKSGGLNAKCMRAGIDRFPRCRILVVGDVMVDEYIRGRVSRISPEAPVPVVEVHGDGDDLRLGGAGNVAHNIHALGGQILLCGVIGNDRMGRECARKVARLTGSSQELVIEADRPTTTKTRVVAQAQQVVRVDREIRRPVASDTTEKLLAIAAKEISSLDAILVSDYGKGVVTETLMDGLRTLTRDTRVCVAVDPKVKSMSLYRGVTLITPNIREAEAMSGIPVEDEASLERAGSHLLKELDCELVLITRGAQGMTLFERGGVPLPIATVARKVFDVTGAGDTVIGAFTLGLAAGLTPRHAALVANIAAGIVVGEIGTAVVPAERLKEALRDGARPHARSRAS